MSTPSPTTLSEQVQNISLIIIAVTFMLFMIITLMICALLHVNKARVTAKKIERQLLHEIFKAKLVECCGAIKDDSVRSDPKYKKLFDLEKRIKANA